MNPTESLTAESTGYLNHQQPLVFWRSKNHGIFFVAEITTFNFTFHWLEESCRTGPKKSCGDVHVGQGERSWSFLYLFFRYKRFVFGVLWEMGRGKFLASKSFSQWREAHPSMQVIPHTLDLPPKNPVVSVCWFWEGSGFPNSNVIHQWFTWNFGGSGDWIQLLAP